MDAQQLARDSLPQGVFDTLPDVVKQSMIAAQQQLIDQQQQLKQFQSEAQQREQKRIEKQQYEQRQARGLARSIQELKASGIADRIGYNPIPFKLNRIEQGHFELSSSFVDIEPEPTSLCGGIIHGFRRCTIQSYIPQMQHILDKANNHKNVQRSATAYIMFHLWSGGKRRYGTRSIGIADRVEHVIDELYKALEVLIADIQRVKHGYSDIYGNTEDDNYIHLYFRANYYPEPKSVINWGINIKPIEIRDSFNIFTASDVKIPCAIQVAQRLWPNSDITTLEAIIAKASPNLCIVKPHSSINNIKFIHNYSDLVIEANSPIKSLSVINTDAIYLLHYDQHLGILENLKQQHRNMYYTSFRPVMKYPNTAKITMCFDIECYFDAEADQRHVPYLCCACFVYDDTPGNVMEFTGNDCIAQMIEYATDTVKSLNLTNIELIAHNGGGYDFHYLLTAINNPSIVRNIMIRNNKFISFKFNHCDITFTVKDSLNFLLCSLNSAARSFLDENDRKTSFPHHEVRTEADLAKVFNEWIDIEQVIDVDIEKEKMIITSDHVIHYANTDNAKTLLQWSKQYCVNDVIVLAKVWVKFKQVVADVFKCHIVDQTMTLAGMSFRLFEAHLPVHLDTHTSYGSIKLYNPTEIDFKHMRASLIGGRCISVNGLYKDVVCLDVKSLYPAAMAYYEQPYGQYRKVTAEVNRELGIYYCKVTPVHINGHGFFPLRNNGDVSYSSNTGEYSAWYTSVDIAIGREEGHSISVTPFEGEYVGYSWKHKGLIFKEYIEGVLYKLKLQYEHESNQEKRQVIKIVMNSLWGKFAQKWLDDKYSIKAEEDCNMFEHQCTKLFDTEYFMVKHQQPRKYSSKPVQNGVFTLSYARYHMYRLWHATVKAGTQCLYSDTDSMMIARDSLIAHSKISIDGNLVPVIGSAMGQLEIEYTFDELICVGKKQYIGKYGAGDNASYKKRFKGVPQQYITPRLFRHLFKSKDNTAKIEFLKFKREWGCVHGYFESKTVRQT